VSKRLAVVGTLLVDTIHRPDLAIVESFGGIAYSVAYLAALADQTAHAAPRVGVQPICRVGADVWDDVTAAWRQFPCLDLSLLIREPGAAPRNTLVYGGGGGEVGGEGGAEAVGVGDRSECPTGLLAPLSDQDIVLANGADLILVNCITGKDISLAALRILSAGCGRVYLDVHSLVLGFADDGKRFYRQPPDGLEWLSCADVVQCNRAEAATLAGLDAFEHDPSGVDEFLQGQLVWASNRQPGRPSVVVLTEGAKGATLLWRHDGRVERALIPAPAVEVLDPTGAGDAFGAGYALAWLLGAGPREAAALGTRTGAAACTVSGIPEAARLQKALEAL